MFEQRFTAKREAGWSEIRRDGSKYSASVDELAGQAELWAAQACKSEIDRRIYLHGDPGWDFVTFDWDGRDIKVDVIHIGAGRNPDTAHVIVNPGHPKLTHADVFMVVGGPEWYAIGAISRVRFIEQHTKKSFGFGEKFAVHCRCLEHVRALLPAFNWLGYRGR
jgi:hypothetical protein